MLSSDYILVSVLEGVAEVVTSPERCDVEIVDFDNLTEDSDEEFSAEFRNMSPEAQRWVLQCYPEWSSRLPG
jgi:hypothetical protein